MFPHYTPAPQKSLIFRSFLLLAASLAGCSESPQATAESETRRADPACPDPTTSPAVSFSVPLKADPGFDPYQRRLGAAFLPDGSLVVAGGFRGKLTVGPRTLQSAGGIDVFVAILSPSGEVSLARRYGGTSDERFQALTTTPNGSIYLAAGFQSATDLGAGPLTPAEGSYESIALVRLDRYGAPRFSKAYSGGDIQSVKALAAHADESVVIAGSFEGEHFDLGLGPVDTYGFSFVAHVDANGSTRFARVFAGSADQEIVGIGIDADQNLFAAGWTKRIRIGNLERRAVGDHDGYALALTPSGELSWLDMLGSHDLDEATSLALDRQGDVFVSGVNLGPLDLGSGMILPNPGFYWARFDAKTGAAERAVPVPYEAKIGVDALGRVALAGTTTDLGGHSRALFQRVSDSADDPLSIDIPDDTALTSFSVDMCGRSALVASGTSTSAVAIVVRP